MRTHYTILSLCMAVLAPLTFQANTPKSTSAASAVCFRENKGQVSDQYFKPRPDVLFSGTDDGLVFHLKQTGISYQLNRIDSREEHSRHPMPGSADPVKKVPFQATIYRLDLNWLNSNASAGIETGEAISGVENYYTEACPNGAIGVMSYKNIVYRSLYKGIDLKWYESGGHLKYDYLVAAGADHRQIAWELKGAESISIDAKGNLIIKTPLGDLVEEAPVVVQDGRRLSAKWLVSGTRISFEIGGINAARPFVIDPLVRLWATYYGGNGAENYNNGCADNANNVFMVGETESATTQNIATVGSYQATYGGPGPSYYSGDAFVVKLSPQGVRLWATYYGGNGSDYIENCAVDAGGNLYGVGVTSSTNANVMTTPGAHQPAYAGGGIYGGDVLLVKFNAAGQRVWGSYYGDTNDDWGLGICIDASGDLYVSGGTNAINGGTVFGTPGAHQPQHAVINTVEQDCFLTKFTSSGVRLWGTYYGGSGDEYSRACRADLNGDVYMAGATSTSVSAVIATSGCHQYTLGATNVIDAFLVKFNSSGARLWGTYYGGTYQDHATSCDIDASGFVYIAGATASSSDIATPGSHKSILTQGRDAFCAKFSPAGVRQWATYYGGNGLEEWGYGAVDSQGNFYLSGVTASSTGTSIATPCSYQPVFGGGSTDCFLAKFSSTGVRLWGTYYGGLSNESDIGNSVIWNCNVFTDRQDNIFIGAFTNALSNSLTIASPGSHQPAYNGGARDAFLVKFDGCRGIVMPADSMLTVCAGKSATISSVPACATYWYSGATGNNLLFPGSLITGPLAGDTTFYAEDLLCGPGLPRTAVNVTVLPSPPITITASNATICAGEGITLNASGAVSYSWHTTPASSAPFAAVVPTANTVYSVTGTGNNGCGRTATIAITANACLGVSEGGIGEQMLWIYPNPNAGEFTIGGKKATQLRLVNSLGQTVKELSLSPGNNYNVQLSGLANGMYFAEVETGEGRVQVQKIIVGR